jgi:signal transduction histidine kinase
MSTDPDEVAALISEVRHDTNNALMAIFGYLELLLLRQGLPDDVRAKLRLVDAEAKKIRDHIARTSAIRRPRA